jgi:AcrR family transcriptional regulator
MPRPSPIAPRKQPRQRRAEVTRDAILQAATQIISANGLGGYNTNAVATRAGVSIGSLYQYFPNKDALMVAVIERQQERQLVTFDQALSDNADLPIEGLVRALVRAAIVHHVDDPLLASAIDHEEARLPVASLLDLMLDRFGQRLLVLIKQHRTHLTITDPEVAAVTLPVMVRSIVDIWSNQSPPKLDLAQSEAVKAVCGYLGIATA